MINIPMYWLFIEAILGGTVALALHELINRIRFARTIDRIKVKAVSEEEWKKIEEQIREREDRDRESDL